MASNDGEFEGKLTAAEEQRVSLAKDRYMRAAHAVQSGTAHKMELDPRYATPKDLRVGIDMSKVDQAGLATVLLRKGVFTLPEYLEAMADEAEAEKSRLEDELSAKMGAQVTLV